MTVAGVRWVDVRNLLIHWMSGLALRLTPTTRIALVDGGKNLDENALVAVAILASAYSGQVCLLCDEPDAVGGRLSHVANLVGAPVGRIEIIDRASVAAVLRFLRAEIVMYTHGIFGSPRPGRRRVHVNLWHGVGPKRNDNLSGPPWARRRVGATVLCASSPVWAKSTVAALRMPVQRVVPANPRMSLAQVANRSTVFDRLGLDVDRKLVVWLPTHRGGRGAGVGPRPAWDLVLTQLGDELVRMADEYGVQFLTKLHPHDSGPSVISFPDLTRVGQEIALHEIIGVSDGMISDYSSAWVDFLLLDRPVILLCPDLIEYGRSRGFKSPSLIEVAQEVVVQSPTELCAFFRDVAQGHDNHRAERRKVIGRLSIAVGCDPIEELTNAVNAVALDGSFTAPPLNASIGIGHHLESGTVD